MPIDLSSRHDSVYLYMSLKKRDNPALTSLTQEWNHIYLKISDTISNVFIGCPAMVQFKEMILSLSYKVIQCSDSSCV